MCGVCGCSDTIDLKDNDEVNVLRQKTEKTLIPIQEKIFAGNDKIAAHNREHFKRSGLLAINLVSSPGSGKTTLLEQTLNKMGETIVGVIEGDQETSRDAERLRKFGKPVIQVNTGEGCHLEANLVHKALHEFGDLSQGVLFIENVGNLVCPAMFDLGESIRGVVASVTEGDDKPYKYPHIFKSAQVVILNKMDLFPYVPFNVDKFKVAVRELNPDIEFVTTEALREDGVDEWVSFLNKQVESVVSTVES